MKKLILSAAIMLAIAASSFAKTTDVNAKILNHFTTEFKGAENVKWVSFDEYTEAIFTWNAQDMRAFYNENGERMILSRKIPFEQLPVNALLTIEKKYAGCSATETIEFNSVEEGLCYYTRMQKNGKEIILKITSDGNDVSVYKKSKQS